MSLIDGFETKGEADLLAEFATPIPVIVICDLLGVPDRHGAAAARLVA